MTNLEVINSAREDLTRQAEEEGTELATFIEEHVNSMLRTEGVAKSVSGKMLSDCISKIREYARTNQKHGCCAVSDGKVIEIVDEFYGIASKEAPAAEAYKKVDVLDLL